MGRFFREDPDPRLPAMERVAAVSLGDGWAASFSALEGASLEPLPHGNHFWFAWATFEPQTSLWKNDHEPIEEESP